MKPSQGMLAWLVEGGLIIGATIGHPSMMGNDSHLCYLFLFPSLFSVVFFCFFPFLSETPSSVLIKEMKSSAAAAAVDPHEAIMDDFESKLDDPYDGSESFRILRKLRSGSEDDVFEEHEQMKGLTRF